MLNDSKPGERGETFVLPTWREWIYDHAVSRWCCRACKGWVGLSLVFGCCDVGKVVHLRSIDENERADFHMLQQRPREQTLHFFETIPFFACEVSSSIDRKP